MSTSTAIGFCWLSASCGAILGFIFRGFLDHKLKSWLQDDMSAAAPEDAAQSTRKRRL